MRKAGWFGMFVVCFGLLWVLALSCDVQAQKQKGKSGKKTEEQKKSEEQKRIEEQKRTEEQDRTDEQKRIEEQKRSEQEKRTKGAVEEQKGKGKAGEAGVESGKAEKVKYKPKGLSDEQMKEWEGSSPPGWSRGGKTGWEGAGVPPGKQGEEGVKSKEMKKIYPPGSEGWDPEKRQQWERNLEQAKERIRRRVEERERSGEGEGQRKEYEERVERSIEEATRRGVPVENAEAVVGKAVDRDMKGEEIEQLTRAMAYGADKGTDYGKLDQFIERKMDEGERGDELAMSAYQEIDERNMEQQQVQQQEQKKKEPWYRRIFRRR
jgi:hypothetical protein